MNLQQSVLCKGIGIASGYRRWITWVFLGCLFGGLPTKAVVHELRLIEDNNFNPVRLEHVVTDQGVETVVSQLPLNLPNQVGVASAVDSVADEQGHIHGVFYTLDRRNERAYHGTLVYVTDRSGSLVMEQIRYQPKGNRDTHYRTPQIELPPAIGRPLIVYTYTENVETGSWTMAHLKSLTQQSDGSWREQVITNDDDGYRGSDGGGYTGLEMSLDLTPQGQPVVAFTDMASYHVYDADFGFSVAVSFYGQIRLARWNNGQWSVNTLYRQSPPATITDSTIVPEIQYLDLNRDREGNLTIEGQPLLSSRLGQEPDGDPVSYAIVSAPDAPVLGAPLSGVVLPGFTHSFSWNQTTPASPWFHLFVRRVGDSSPRIEQWVETPAYGPVDDLPAGDYEWWVQGWTTGGTGPWSEVGTFTIPSRAPGMPGLTQPANGSSLRNRQPTFGWTAPSPAGTWYQVFLSKDGRTFGSFWVNGDTAWTPDAALSAGSYQWWVRGWNPDGYGEWAGPYSFTLPLALPGAITQTAPSGAQAGNDLLFTWQKDANATWYRVWVGRADDGTWRDQWVETSGSGTGSLALSGHPGGTADWWIRPWGPDGYGPWSGPMTFTTPDPAPATPDVSQPPTHGPSGTVLSWPAAARAEWYRVYVSRNGAKVADRWTQATELNLGTLSPGAYTWWLGAWNATANTTIWSQAGGFGVP